MKQKGARTLLKEMQDEAKRKKVLEREWYSLRSILGYWWALFYFLLGGREAGKSYAVTDFFVKQWKEYGRPFYWLRLTEASQKKLLTNNAEKLIDPDLRRKYNLDLTTNSDSVFEITKRDPKTGKIKEKKLMARVLCLSTFYNDKGSGLFDKEFLDDPKMYYNIALDEMNREANERKTFDIVYAFVNQLENLVRSTKQRIRVICIGNTLEEASDLLSAFNFLPEQFGRYKLVKNKKALARYLKELDAAKTDAEKRAVNRKYKNYDFGKRAVIEYIEPGSAYQDRRKGTIADIVSPLASTFTNEVKIDNALITKKRLIKPSYAIQFTREDIFTVWDGNVIAEYNKEKVDIIPMRPYLDKMYNLEKVNNIIEMFDIRAFLFRNLITQKKFKKCLELLKPRK